MLVSAATGAGSVDAMRQDRRASIRIHSRCHPTQQHGPRPPCPPATAPEQLLGSPCTLTADIYSLGVLLVVLATRRLLSNRGEWELPRAPRDCPSVSDTWLQLGGLGSPGCVSVHWRLMPMDPGRSRTSGRKWAEPEAACPRQEVGACALAMLMLHPHPALPYLQRVVALIERCIAPEPALRPSAAEVLHILQTSQSGAGCCSKTSGSSVGACHNSSLNSAMNSSSPDVQPP